MATLFGYLQIMAATYDIDVDPIRNLVRLRLDGFFTADDVRAFEAARDAAHTALTCAPNAHLTLADVRGMLVQPQDVVATFGGLLANPKQQSAKLALVFASVLFKQQLARAADGRRIEFFTDVDSAERWLFAA